jgi:monooxygenase
MSADTDTDVLILGAGLSGIGMAARLRQTLPGKRLLVLEAREACGGTWDLFRYPGIRSDSDMFTLGYPFRPWSGSQPIAQGDAIRRYLEDTIHEFGLASSIRRRCQALAADWSAATRCWTVRIRDAVSGEESLLRARWLIACTGYYRYDRAHRPEFPGESSFSGPIVHPQFWPRDLPVAGRRVLVIGSGATAITLVPALAAAGARVTMLQRSPSYVLPLGTRDPVGDLLRRALPARLAFRLIRWRNLLLSQALYGLVRRFPEASRRLLIRRAARSLPTGFDVARHFSPRYAPWDERLCIAPDGDFFRAIRSGAAAIETGVIERFVPDGVILESGARLEADLVVTATGLALALPSDLALSVDGEPVLYHQRMMYRGMMLSDLPNYVHVFGYTNASWTLRSDLIARRLCRLLARMDRRAMSVAVAPRDPAVGSEPFVNLQSGYIRRQADRLPAQGNRYPWRLRQNYPADFIDNLLSPIEDGVLRLS